MASYFIDLVCLGCHFQGCSQNWMQEISEHMHIHYKIFCNPSYKIMHETTSELFISPFYQIIFGEYNSCMSKRAKEILIKVSYWFPIGEATIVKVFLLL